MHTVQGTAHSQVEHEDVLDRMQQRINDDPSKLALRSMAVEHPFGTIKSWMGNTHFKMR